MQTRSKYYLNFKYQTILTLRCFELANWFSLYSSDSGLIHFYLKERHQLLETLEFIKHWHYQYDHLDWVIP